MSILDILSIFDWVTPAAAAVGDITNGPAHTLLIPQRCGRSGRDIERTLRQAGIKTWGAMIVSGRIMLTVPSNQVDQAHRELDRLGVRWEQ